MDKVTVASGTKLAIEYTVALDAFLKVTFKRAGGTVTVLDISGPAEGTLDDAMAFKHAGTLTAAARIVQQSDAVKVTLRGGDEFSSTHRWVNGPTQVNREYQYEVAVELAPSG